MLNIFRILQNVQNLGPFGTILGVDLRVLLSLNWSCNVTGGVKIWKFENLDIIVFPMPKLVYMQIFDFLFHLLGKLLTFYPFYGTFGPKLIMWRHRMGKHLKIWKFRHHYRIPHAKISLHANFRLFIPFTWEIIDILPILRYFWA